MVDILHRIMYVSMQMLAILVLISSLYRDTCQVNGQICNTPDWLDYGDSQYLIVNYRSTWSAARTYCQGNDGDLAVISSHEQTTFLVTYTLKAYGGYSYWIGLHDSDGDGQYTWIDDTQPEYSNWSPSQPSRSHECGLMRSTYSVLDQGKWQTSFCSDWRVHICQRPKDSRCSWHRFGQSLYRFYGEALVFDDAKANCISNGGDLAIIKSEELNSFLVGFISTSNPSRACYWLGLMSDIGNSFVWVDGTAGRTESSWAPGEPNFGSLMDYCACMYSFVDVTDERHGKWNDVLCSSAKPYICERPQVKSEAWIDYPNVQYHMPSFSASYFEAIEYCKQLGGSLAQMKTSEINLNLTNSFSGYEFWFGLDTLGKEGVFQWADGSLLQNSRFTMWMSGQPNNFQGYQFCVARLIDGWNDQFCNGLRRFVCEISKGCPPGKWYMPICDRLCDNCYNGGVCNPQTGTCTCAPGFTGKNCLTACGDQRFGSECELLCGSAVADDSSCTGNKFCLPGPNECRCIAGYAGAFCNETCRDGQFGSDCLQDCHCIDGMPCDVFTGRCEEGCAPGWSGEGCQVPSVCPLGYFGVSCTDHCNCPDNVGCDKVSGYCITTEGQCEVGFTSDSVDMPGSCNSYTGCYNLCSGTCHCRDGEDDCDSVTGSCSSGRCHPRWTGESCQIGRFQSAREKTNPGIAMFSCAISFDSPTNVEPDFVKATTGSFSIDNWETAKDPPQDIFSTLHNFTFNIQDFTDDSPIYCFIGDPFNNSSEFGYVKLASAAFYELPILTSLPTLIASSQYWVVISWRPWNRYIDTGDGPITGYIVYVHIKDGNETHSATLLSDGSLDTGSSRGRREVTSEGLDLLEYNITGLEDGTNYEIQIAVIREGPKGEGDRGPPFSVKTQELSSSPPSGSIATVAGSAVGAVVVIVIVIILIIIVYRRRSDESATSKSEGKESDSSPQYENPVFDPSKTDLHTYQDLNTDPQAHTYQDISTDGNTYQDLKEPAQEANYEALNDAITRDYVNVPGI